MGRTIQSAAPSIRYNVGRAVCPCRNPAARGVA